MVRIYMLKLINVSTYTEKIFFICLFNAVLFLILLMIVRYFDYESKILMYLILILFTIIGSLCSLGECIFLGFLKDFDYKNVASWGAGTGLGAFSGSLLIYLQNLSNGRISYDQ